MEIILDRYALRKMGYGLYIVSSILDGKPNGQIANTVFQITSKPVRIAAAISRSNLTHEYIKESLRYSISILQESTPFPFIGLFGFRSGRVIDKFATAAFRYGTSGCPIITENAVAFMEAKVVNQLDIGTHTLFIGEVTEAEILNDNPPMTYLYYQEKLKGKTPVDSPTFIPENPAS
ncbi:conserved hypothetical protein [Candidatus Zixiibacteriota bacterium]|nr:conserved hypothetical protein [candidate division Zixibacteria bacterium]